jgi:bifunctional UDP-N-acetylglucosamine pyrophosphorylase/glucosamine-1-phosphate N-acetyltransferase
MPLPKKSNNTAIIILAAGLGKRMHSSLPKVLVPVCGRAMILHILDRVQESAPGSRVALVVGHQKEKVIEAVQAENYSKLNIEFVVQPEQKGTGHAVRCAMESSWGKNLLAAKGCVLVLPGDLPLITNELIEDMTLPLQRATVIRLLTAQMPDPAGYGRIVRKGKKGSVLRIVEEKDANLRERLITEVGLSIYSFQSAFLSVFVQSLKNTNAQKEFYLTDLIEIATKKKRTIETLPWADASEVRGINNPYELSQVCSLMMGRVVKAHALAGVRFMSLTNVRIESSVRIEPDVTVYSNVILEGATRIGSGSVIGPGVYLKNVVVGTQCEIKAGTIAEDSEIASQAKVGPYAHLRPESKVGERSKIGNFVELKKTTIAEDTSISHLSYLGDAIVGSRVNIGCGFVTCNYDGRIINGQRKHQTIIEDDVFVGSDCQTVAPVVLKKGSFVASGSTITEEVPQDSLAIARSRQVNKLNYAKKLKT